MAKHGENMQTSHTHVLQQETNYCDSLLPALKAQRESVCLKVTSRWFRYGPLDNTVTRALLSSPSFSLPCVFRGPFCASMDISQKLPVCESSYSNVKKKKKKNIKTSALYHPTHLPPGTAFGGLGVLVQLKEEMWGRVCK